MTVGWMSNSNESACRHVHSIVHVYFSRTNNQYSAWSIIFVVIELHWNLGTLSQVVYRQNSREATDAFFSVACLPCFSQCSMTVGLMLA